MGTRAFVAAVFAVFACSAGCNYGAGAYSCMTNDQCGAGGQCESDHFCSVPDTACESGRVYSDLSGSRSGTCVGGGQPGVDAAVPPVDGSSFCYGTGIVKVCLAEAPTQPRTISTPTVIDTGDASMCAATTSGGESYCVIAASNIIISEPVRATGPKPLVLISTDSITTTALIDAGSRRERLPGVPEFGAGANPPPAACGAGTPPSNGGGGAGGSFAGAGGTGGHGRGANTGGGTPAAVATAFTELRAGCPGQVGQGGGTDGGAAGYGGGAVFLIAAKKIEINGGINAGGEGGGPGAQNQSGGGGGGAGGMIGFDAPTVTVTSLLVANGGGGGEGSGDTNTGKPGADALAVTAAAGGKTGSGSGGDGGNGSAGPAAGTGAPGNNGTGGGGAGGGGAGVILAPANASLGPLVSPAATH